MRIGGRKIGQLGPLAISIALASCSAKLQVYQYDNPHIRNRQSEQLDRTLPDPAERQRMMRLIGPRVGFLVRGEPGEAFDPQKVSAPSGRAAAISPDGYYMTALHVVQELPFYLVETSLRSGENAGIYPLADVARHYDASVSEGRVVWKDAKLDLAILKFEKTSPHYFGSWRAGAPHGTMLHAADDWGRGILKLKDGTADMTTLVGNGAFQAAGAVRSSGKRKRGTGGTLIESRMVARGGMSGAPLVTPAGEMAGIIIQVEINPLMTNSSQTIGIMIEPERIAQIIDNDRRKQAGHR